MAYETKIEWSQSTWNPITGCSRVSKGCEHCYAETLAAGRLRHHPSRAGLTDYHGRWNGEVRFNEEWLDQPRHWHKPRRIFVCAHSDLFHENVPDEWINRVFVVMAQTPQHVFQLLTKRPERMRDYIIKSPAFNIWYGWWPPQNVWLGTSVEDCVTAHERILPLLKTPAAVRWISAEPLLAPIDISPYFRRNLPGDASTWQQPTGLDWVVCGGESGPGYRPMEPRWARCMSDQCETAGVPFFMKQMAGKKPIPADLLIRQYPA